MTHDWAVAHEKARPIVEELDKLTADQRVKLFEFIEEVYCFECGRYQHLCRCTIDDRW